MNTRQVLEELAAILNRHLQHFRNALAFVLHFHRLAVVSFAFADFARHVNVRQEVHLDLDDAIPTTSLTTAALHVKAEAALLVAANLGFVRIAHKHHEYHRIHRYTSLDSSVVYDRSAIGQYR